MWTWRKCGKCGISGRMEVVLDGEVIIAECPRCGTRHCRFAK